MPSKDNDEKYALHLPEKDLSQESFVRQHQVGQLIQSQLRDVSATTTTTTRNKSNTAKTMHTGRILSRAYAAIREWS